MLFLIMLNKLPQSLGITIHFFKWTYLNFILFYCQKNKTQQLYTTQNHKKHCIQIQLVTITIKQTAMQQSAVRRPPAKSMINRQTTFNETFDSSIGERPQKFALEKTLCQGIKLNDSSKIIENTEESSGAHVDGLYDEQKQVHDIFVNTRKKFDQSKQNTAKLEQNIQRYKREKQMLTLQKTKLQSNLSNEQKDFQKNQQHLDKLTTQCDSIQYEKDIRLQMLQVLKQDILYYKKRCFESNAKIVRNHNKLKSLNEQLESTKKMSSNCRSLIYSIEKKITDNQTKRCDKLSSFHDVINKKMQNTMKKEERQKMAEESMLEALYGKMPEQQEQKKLLLSNLVLKKMLKSKMQRQMEKFNQIESSFRKIQQNTTVKRVDQFVDKFIKRQKIYGELLESISKNEDKISSLKQKNEELQKQHSQLSYMKQMIEEKENEKKSESSKQFNMSIDLLRENLLKNEFLKNKALAYSGKFIAAFDGKTLGQVNNQLDRETPHLSLKEALERVNSFLNEMAKDEQDKKLKEISIEPKNLALPQSVKTRNIRIKTLTSMDQNQQSAMQNYDMAHDDLSQIEYLNQNRKQIKKSAYLRNRIKTKAV